MTSTLAATVAISAGLVIFGAPAGASAQAPSVPELGHPLGATPGTGGGRAKPVAQPTRGGFREIKWEELVPPDWNPMEMFQGMNLGVMNDADPRAIALLKRMREVWDNAPANNAIDGAAVRIPGYIVPLEESRDGMTEFLLVPYFGACIHTPPPPANQIIHVKPKTPAKGYRAMDTVWINGTLNALRTDSTMGVSGYRLQADSVEPYTEKRP